MKKIIKKEKIFFLILGVIKRAEKVSGFVFFRKGRGKI